jgi:hypothetical protein
VLSGPSAQISATVFSKSVSEPLIDSTWSISAMLAGDPIASGPGSIGSSAVAEGSANGTAVAAAKPANLGWRRQTGAAKLLPGGGG